MSVQGPVGFLGTEAFQRAANQGREGMWRQQILVPPEGVHARVLSHSVGPTLFYPMDHNQPGSSVHGDSPSKNTGVGCHALLQGIFPTQRFPTASLLCLLQSSDSLTLIYLSNIEAVVLRSFI